MPLDLPMLSRLVRRLRGATSATLLVVGAALAQSTSPFGNTAPPGGRPSLLPARPAQPAAPGAAPASPASAQVLARVGDRAITQDQFDQMAGPYLSRLRTEMGGAFTADVMKSARQTVLDELIRREVLSIEAGRQKIQVSEEETDALLRQDPFLQTDGKFDPAKLKAFKSSPQSNYLQLLPQLREIAATRKLDQQVRERLTPSRAEARAEFEKRSAQVRLRFLLLPLRDMSLEPESAEPDWRAYYDAHPTEFMKRARMRLFYRRLPLPAATDSSRAAAESLAVERGRLIADSLRAGTLADSTAETQDTGLFEVGASLVPGLGRVPDLAAGIAQAETVSSLRVLGPYRLPEAVVVATVAERKPKEPQTFIEAMGKAKRSADIEKRKAAAEADRRAWFDAHRDRYRGTRAGLSRATLKLESYKRREIPGPEIDRWYQAHGHTLYGLPDSSRAWIPPVSDSLRGIVRQRMFESERDAWIAATMGKLASGLKTARDFAAFARANSAIAETLSLVRGMPPDSLFPVAVVDSILAGAVAQKGLLQGPRSFGAYSAVWRVDTADTAFTPTFEAARSRIEPDFMVEKRAKEEQDGRAWHGEHVAEYVTPVKYVIDYVAVPIPSADSVRISEPEIAAEYRRNIATYRHEEEVRARHLLLSTRDGGSDTRAKARADSLLEALKSGADFVDLAKRFSQEPGAASSGGDLGWFGRGRMVPEFERAAFALKAGEMSPVVKTQFGYHIIKLEERRAAGTKPLEEVRAGILSSLARARADSLARRAAEKLRRQLALATDPKGPTEPYGGVKTSPSFAANEPVGTLGAIEGLPADIPKLSAGRWAPKVYRAGRNFVVLRPRSPIPSRPASFDEVRARAIEDAKNAKKKQLLDRKVAEIRSGLAAGAKLDSLAAPYGGLKESGPVTSNAGFVPGLGSEPRFVQKAFAAKPGDVSDTLQVTQGVAWFQVEDRTTGDASAFDAAQPQLSQELLRQRYDQWLEGKKKTLVIEILRPEFRVARPAAGGAAVTTAR